MGSDLPVVAVVDTARCTHTPPWGTAATFDEADTLRGAMCAWLIANGISPDVVPLGPPIQIVLADAPAIRFMEIVLPVVLDPASPIHAKWRPRVVLCREFPPAHIRTDLP